MICTVECQEIEVVGSPDSFHLCLFLSYVNQTTKSNLSNIIIKFGVVDFQNKRQISYNHGNYSLH